MKNSYNFTIIALISTVIVLTASLSPTYAAMNVDLGTNKSEIELPEADLGGDNGAEFIAKVGDNEKATKYSKKYFDRNMKQIEVLKEELEVKRAIRPEPVDTTGFDNIYRAAGEKYGVPWEVLSAVHYVETGRRGDTGIRSYAGALGPMQFIPSTWRAYGVDGDGDGSANINDVDDAIFSAANYLAASGAGSNINRALFAYNHSNAYVNKVLGVARSVGYGA